MTVDPFEALRRPVTPLAPRAAFATELRRRMEEALGDRPPPVRAPATGAMGAVVPYLAVDDPAGAIEWYVEVFGAVEVGERVVMPDGSIGHAELRIGRSRVFLAGEYREEGVATPTAHGVVTAQLVVEVPDAEAVFERAVAAGADVWRPVDQYPYGRMAKVRDPFGHNWMISEVPAPARGQVGYFTLAVPDADRAVAFYRGLLGWQPVPGSMPQGFHVANADPPGGILGGADVPGVRVSVRVPDVVAAVARVRELGGEADDVQATPSGRSATCRDDQGLEFDLWEPAPGY